MSYSTRRLLRGHPWELISFGVERADTVRFLRLFREVWSRIPLADRRKLLKRWRDLGSFRAELCVWKSDLSSGDCGTYATGQYHTSGLGDEITVCARLLRVLNDAQARHIIAHELAHGLQCATGHDFGAERAVDYEDREYEMEAECIAEDWFECPDENLSPDQRLRLHLIQREQLDHDPDRLARLDEQMMEDYRLILSAFEKQPEEQERIRAEPLYRLLFK